MEYLTILAVGANQSDVVRIFWELIAKYDVHVLRSKITALQSDFGFMVSLAGNWNSIAKLEEALKNLEGSTEVSILLKRSKEKILPTSVLPYRVQIVGVDETEIIYEICYFFTSLNISIHDFILESGHARDTDTSIFNLNMIVHIPSDFSISHLREQFIALCDELNIDGNIESDVRML
jgi:glycine cleavage system transcriptional repressor